MAQYYSYDSSADRAKEDQALLDKACESGGAIITDDEQVIMSQQVDPHTLMRLDDSSKVLHESQVQAIYQSFDLKANKKAPNFLPTLNPQRELSHNITTLTASGFKHHAASSSVSQVGPPLKKKDRYREE